MQSILEELQATAPLTEASAVPTTPPFSMDETQRRLWEFLIEQPRHLDEMAQQLGMNVAQIAGALLTLEMKKAVRRLPGNRYERC